MASLRSSSARSCRPTSALVGAGLATAALAWAVLMGTAASAQEPIGSGAGLGDPEAPPPVIVPRLIVTVTTRSDEGLVFCGLWRGREGYPTERARAVGQALDRTVRDHRATCVFEGVTAGEYAVAVFHDENANNDLDRNVFGIPTEGTGASNDAWNMFGPPGYDDARFAYPDVREHRLTVHIRY